MRFPAVRRPRRQPMQAAEIIEYLDWDSSFFGLRIARLKTRSLNREILVLTKDWCERESIDCVYMLADAGDFTTTQLAAEHGFDLVDIRVTLDKRLASERTTVLPSGTARVRSHRPEDLPQLRQIAKESHRDTRFYHDPRFPRDKCDQLYETWIQNSCRGYAQAVFVAEHAGKIAGYVTCHLNACTGQIGLIAVAADHRRAGLGAELLSCADRWFVSQGATSVRIVTQGRNISAMRLDERAGFQTCAVELWYHRWFHRNAGGYTGQL